MGITRKISVERKINIFGPTGHILRSRDAKDAIIKDNYASSDAAKWLFGVNVKLNKPIETIRQLLCKKPSYEIHPLNFLVSCLGRVKNIYDKNAMRPLHILATAIDYVNKMETPRKELRKAFLSLTSEGKKAEEITHHMIKERLKERRKLSCFTVQNERHAQEGELKEIINDDNMLNKRLIRDSYLEAVIKVYLHLNEFFTDQ